MPLIDPDLNYEASIRTLGGLVAFLAIATAAIAVFEIVSVSSIASPTQRGEQLASLTTGLVVVDSGFETAANEHLWDSLFSNYRQKIQSIVASLATEEAKFKREIVVGGETSKFAAIEAFDLFNENEFTSYRPAQLLQQDIEGRSLSGTTHEDDRDPIPPMQNVGQLFDNSVATIELLSFGTFDVSFSSVTQQAYKWAVPCQPGGEDSFSGTLSMRVNGYFEPTSQGVQASPLLALLDGDILFHWQ